MDFDVMLLPAVIVIDQQIVRSAQMVLDAEPVQYRLNLLVQAVQDSPLLVVLLIFVRVHDTSVPYSLPRGRKGPRFMISRNNIFILKFRIRGSLDSRISFKKARA